MIKKCFLYLGLLIFFLPILSEGSDKSGILDYKKHEILDELKNSKTLPFSDETMKMFSKIKPNSLVCPPPTALIVASILPNSVDLSWVSGGSLNWQIEFGPVGFSTGGGTIVTTNTNPTTINGLTPNTSYDFYVRDSCAINDISSWFGPISATTNCGLVNAPFIENFEGPGWTAINMGNIDSCWERNNSSGFFWTTRQGFTPAINSGPFSDHTTGFGKFIYSEGGTSHSTTISSPWIDISSLSNPELRFWQHMYGVDIEKMSVLIHDGNSWSNELTILGPQHISSSSSLWQEQIINLSAYIGDTIKIRFRAFKFAAGDDANMAIDDIWIGNSPNCFRPSNFSEFATSDSSVFLSWIGSGATNWQVKYRVAGSSSPFIFLSTNNSNILVTGLDSLLNYEFYVQDSCGFGDVSFWEGPLISSTRCPIISAPWAEDFEDISWVPGTGLDNLGNKINECWFRDIGITQQWGTGSGLTTSTSTGPPGAFSGSNYIYREASGGGMGTANIKSPKIYIPNNMVSPIFHFQKSLNGDFIDSLVILIDNGSGSSIIFSELGPGSGSSTSSWEADSINLSAFIGDTISLIFIGVNSGIGGDIAIDDIGIREQWVPCLAPQNLSFSNVTPNSVDLTWTSVNLGLTQLRYHEFGVSSGGVLLKNVTSPYTLSNLKPNTTYVIEILDSCTSGIKSALQSNNTTTIPCPKPSANFVFNSQALTTSFASTSIIADSLIWDFDGLGVSNSTSPIFSFPAAGTYDVKLKVFSFCENVDSMIIPISVCDTLEARWDYLILSKSGTGMSIQFDGSLTKNSSSFIWDFGDGFTNTGSLTPVHNYSTQSLSYLVKLIIENNCGEKDTLAKQLNQIGLEELEEIGKMKIYPNPAKDILNVQWENVESNPEFFEVYDSKGKLIRKMDLNKNELESALLQIDTQDLPSGLFFIRLHGEKLDIKKQFIITH